MSILEKSWGSFSSSVAENYLKTFGHPSANSKTILVDVLKNLGAKQPTKLLDIGCGNAQLLEFFKSKHLNCSYTGVDFSEPLLRVAMRNHPDATFIFDDVHLMTKIDSKFDVALFSHVIETLPSPEKALHRAKELSDRMLIRFFEPPEHEFDFVELLEMSIGDQTSVPYLRRKMSKSYYLFLLDRLGIRKVSIYRDETSKDQIHLLEWN